MSRRTVIAVLLSASPLVGCEVPPCPKDTLLRADQTPCDCDGVLVEELECGGATCTAYGVFATTSADTGCGGTTTETTPSSR